MVPNLLSLFLSLWIIATIVYLLVQHSYRKSGKLPLPPGPPGHWLYGNAYPQSHACRTFAEWTKVYGPVFSLKVGNTIFISIGTYQAAIDIMEKEGVSLVDRPRNIAAGEILGGGMRTLLARQGDRFKRIRKATQSQFSARMIDNYKPIQYRFAKKMILDILADPSRHINHSESYSTSTIMSITYGKTTPSTYSDPAVISVIKCFARLGAALQPGAWTVNQYPILQYVPGYLTPLIKGHQEELTLFREQLDVVRKQIITNEVGPCFSKYVLERQAEYRLSDDEVAYLSGGMFGAGSDTTASAISIVIMASACFPEAQEAVQKQLDSVVGQNRLPVFDDINGLTEVVAFVYESYRWRPVSAGGFAHRATKDIIYKGFLIPKGAAVQGNHWAIGKDPSVYPDPESFKPSRWLDQDGRVDETYKFPNFGFGRRVCPGQHLANHSLFINTALLLWSFNIREDPSKPINTLAFTDSANTHPLPFNVIFEPRHANVKSLVQPD